MLPQVGMGAARITEIVAGRMAAGSYRPMLSTFAPQVLRGSALAADIGRETVRSQHRWLAHSAQSSWHWASAGHSHYALTSFL